MKYRITWTYASGYYSTRIVTVEARDRYDAVRELTQLYQRDGEQIKVIDIKQVAP